MINNYRTEIETANRRELMEIIEAYALGIDYYEVDDTYELREYTMDKLEAENNLYECVEDDILNTIMNGNWTDAAQMMHENYISPNGLVDYINDYRYEEFDEAYEFFTLDSAVAITELYHRKEVA